MKSKQIFLKVISVLLLAVLLSVGFKFNYRNEVKKYLKDTYNEDFSVSLIPKMELSQYGNYYVWKAKSKSHKDKPFEVSYFGPGMTESGYREDPTYSDSYSTELFREDIINYYENIVSSTWNNSISRCLPNRAYDVYKTSNDYMKEVPTSLYVYIKCDDTLDYDIEAEKIFNLINNEHAKNHTMYIDIYYLNSELYEELSKDGHYGLIDGFNTEAYYRYNLDTEQIYYKYSFNKELIVSSLKNIKQDIM